MKITLKNSEDSEPCPLPMRKLTDYLSCEFGEKIYAKALSSAGTAKIDSHNFWLWIFSDSTNEKSLAIVKITLGVPHLSCWEYTGDLEESLTSYFSMNPLLDNTISIDNVEELNVKEDDYKDIKETISGHAQQTLFSDTESKPVSLKLQKRKD